MFNVFSDRQELIAEIVPERINNMPLISSSLENGMQKDEFILHR